MERLSAIQVNEYAHYAGGGFYDSIAHAELFRSDNPHHFGVMTSRLFSSTENMGMTNKRWNYMTEAQGRVYEIPLSKTEYTWQAMDDARMSIRIVSWGSVTSTDQVGKGGKQFRVGVDYDFYAEPGIMKTEDDNAPLIKIVGEPEVGDESAPYFLTFEIQGSNPDLFIDGKYFSPGRTLRIAGSSISNEENYKYRSVGPFSAPLTLRSQVGQVGAEVTMTDLFIRRELQAAKSKQKNTASYTDVTGQPFGEAFSRGHVYYWNAKDKNNKEARYGFFMGVAEERVLEAVEEDCYLMMEFGNWETSLDRDNNRVKRVAPGWRQLVRDGQYFPHNGYFTLEWLQEKLLAVVHNRRAFSNREIVLSTGIGGMLFISQLIADYAPIASVQEPGFAIRGNNNPTGIHDHEYETGFMFTRFKGALGLDVRIMYDPRKDDSELFRQKAPGSYLPLESFQIDILEFGDTEYAAEGVDSKSNIFMARSSMSDYYFSIANVMKKNGITSDGSVVANMDKKVSIHREKSGSLGIWDTGGIGRIEWIVTDTDN